MRVAMATAKPDRVECEIWKDGVVRKQMLRKGRLGINVAKVPAPQALKDPTNTVLVSTVRSGREFFAQLPGTAWEIDSLDQRFRRQGHPVEKFTKANASEPNLRKIAQDGELQNFRFIHRRNTRRDRFTIPGSNFNHPFGRGSRQTSEKTLKKQDELWTVEFQLTKSSRNGN